MPSIELTDAERLILAGQHDILAVLKPDEADYHQRLANNLRYGHRWLYEKQLQVNDVATPEDENFVLDVLGFFSLLRNSFEALSDTTGIEELDITFPGFDGNNESELLSFAQALTDNGQFQDLLGDVAKNSHMPTRRMYHRMMGTLKTLHERDGLLTKEEIASVLAARRT